MGTKNSKPYKQNPQRLDRVEDPAVAYESRTILNHLRISDDYSLVRKAKQGINTEVFYSLADAIKMPEKTLASIINLSPRTISNYREQKKFLDANYSEHLLKLISLFEKGKEYLGNIDEFNSWLEKPMWGLDECPKEFLNTSGGVDLIMLRLERMAQGYPV